jgi:hypothetical protein
MCFMAHLLYFILRSLSFSARHDHMKIFTGFFLDLSESDYLCGDHEQDTSRNIHSPVQCPTFIPALHSFPFLLPRF